MAIYDDVYGLSYVTAKQEMALRAQAISSRANIGFTDTAELKAWAKEYCLDKMLYSSMSHKFLYISHKGEIMSYDAYDKYYGNILFTEEKQGNRIVKLKWMPEGFEYLDNAYIAGEQSDGTHKPLYYRNYCEPTGHYSKEKDAFNVAKPFPVFAAETGRDTSHIYTYINHVAGECALHLLAWLRAKMMYPNVKTQVVPIIVSKAQGSGKTTFAEVICKGLFGKDNVLVTDQYDSGARFNADYADALIVCQEEKELEDKRNPAGALKSRATATTIRKEQKGIDPIYQESYTDFIMTTNKDVPIKFDGREDQRRFMIMEADETFTRKLSDLADEVFTKLYGYDANYNKVGKPFVEDKELIAQFKHELFTRADIAAVELRNFPKTAAYKKCFTLPRTSESTEIESIMRAVAPFIRASLLEHKLVTEVDGNKLEDIVQFTGAVQYMPPFKEHASFVALCRPLVFYELNTMKAFNHSTVERGIYDCGPWLISDFGLAIVPDMEPLIGGFQGVAGRYRTAAAAKFCLVEDAKRNPVGMVQYIAPSKPKQEERVGKRLRINKKWKVDNNGCFETVNEMRPGVTSLENKTQNVQYMDTFLLESDTPTAIQRAIEEDRATKFIAAHGEGAEIDAAVIYKERLQVALSESMRLFNDGIACRVVYSGAKSYHVLVRVADAPKTVDEYKWLHAYLCTELSDKLEFDYSTADPARLTRSPLTLDRVTADLGLLVVGEQKLICEDWSHVYRLYWRELYEHWQNRPLKPHEQKLGKPIYPTKQEYIDAAQDIITGDFWSGSKYDGDRQRLFFPAYRLLRVLGNSFDDIWDKIIPEHIDEYSKADERQYWLSRKNSALIANIEQDIDEYNGRFE